jgi:hypothetical protein
MTLAVAAAPNRDARNQRSTPVDGHSQVKLLFRRAAGIGRVGMWRGGIRFGLSVAAPFVWRCPSNLAVAPFPHPSHRTGHADRPH